RPGRYTIGPAKVRIGNGVIQTEPITIEVSKGNAPPPAPAEALGQQRGDPNLFISLVLSKSKAYVGEQILASYYVYNRYPNVEIAKVDPSKPNGFWVEELNVDNAPREQRVVNGLQYSVTLIKQQLLLPQRSGTLRIEPMAISFIVNRSFFSRGTPVDARSNAAEITAMPLPAGAPPGFNGAVGELELTVKADRSEVKVDEAIEVEVKLEGRANLKLIEAPNLQFPSDFEVYEPRVADRIGVSQGGMSGSRGFQYTVIPRHDGTYTLGPLTIAYFDPKAGTYKTISSPSLTIAVAPGEGGPASASAPRVQRADVATLDTDIRYIRTGDMALRPKDRWLFGSWHWLAGMSAPPLAFALLIAWSRKRQRDRADATGMRRRAADRMARKRLREAEAALGADDSGRFHAALSKAIQGYIADKLGLGIAAINAEAIEQRLAKATEAKEIATDATRLIAECEMARFAPAVDKPRRELYHEAVNLIQRIERAAEA
ncbi:MAG: BatD family protein, partial [Flavobacteriales bacterium]